ncbi:hypothetical protein CCMSSC00406_0005018 [Pleurotus cornucopiae]|uniref:Uncharacterized protein n=1 Tax=Pleurotus cornucopiae TaxID=5321 RepID=A0ACB7J6C1_PLECO|nr:hypothetical protein CCMSSC00406_0005018 [Pleurotus cornucopiae]
MSSGGDEEYEVDYILKARIEYEKPKARKKKLIWKFRVRWKGYTEGDDTWEPAESFEGSEELIERFWARCEPMLQGRDPNDMSRFEYQDEVFPTGPPRIRHKRKVAPPTDASPPASKRHQTSPLPEPAAQCLPDSLPAPCPPDPPPISSASSSALATTTMPSHRARAANPRVKMVDDPQLTELADAIPAKARVSSSRPRVSGSRAGPGRNSQLEISTPRRSSLLTYDKGKRSLRSVKKAEPVQAEQRAEERHSLSPDVDESAEIPGLSIPDASVVVVPPTAAELLRLSGADEKSVADLVDFQDDTLVTPTLAYPEDTIPPRSPSQPPTAAAATTTAGTGVVSVLRQSLATVKETLFPSASPAVPEQRNKWRISDANSTIFGALASGSGETDESESPTAKFFLSFDSSAAAPVRLLCASPDTPDAPTPTPTLDEIIKTQAKGPAGQFYQQEYAHNLLNSLRSVGPSAKVVLDDSEASDDQRKHYERFQTKLRAGELFVEFVHEDLLAFCVPESADIVQRLNFPASLRAEAGHILVMRVMISNPMGYHEAIENADTNRW